MSTVLPCLILPIRENTLILPSSAVAEIVAYEKPKEVVDAPEWLEGIFMWRGINIPLTHLEKISPPSDWNSTYKKQEKESKRRYVAVLNRFHKPQETGDEKRDRYPFFGIILQEVPKLQRVVEENIKIVTQFPKENTRYLMEVKTQGEYVLIPNLESLWNMIDALPPRLQWFRQIVV